MDFSLLFFGASSSLSGSGEYRLLLDAAAAADRMGFKAVWTPERHFNAFGGLFPNPALTSAAIAVLTKNIIIRAGSVILPLHNPIRVAEDFSVVDNLSDGRVEIACVTGWHADDYIISPASYADKERLLSDHIETVRTLWTGRQISRENGLGVMRAVSIYPRPVQPELNIWRVCQRTSSCEWTGRNGINTLTSMLQSTKKQVEERIHAFRSARDAAGTTAKLALMMHTFVSDDAVSVAWPAYKKYLGINMDFQKSVVIAQDGEVYAGRQDDLEAIYERAFRQLTTTHGMIGTVEDCIPKVEELKRLGVDEIACLIDFGIPGQQVLDGLGELNRLRKHFA